MERTILYTPKSLPLAIGGQESPQRRACICQNSSCSCDLWTKMKEALLKRKQKRMCSVVDLERRELINVVEPIAASFFFLQPV